jgi:hypothetical protein
MQPECSQQPVTGPYPSGISPSGFAIRTLYAFLFYPIVRHAMPISPQFSPALCFSLHRRHK